MKFTVSKESFLTALQKAQNVVEKKNTVQILSNVLLSSSKDSLSLTATDLEVGINVSIPINDALEGKVAVSAKNLLEIVKELPNKPVTLFRKENNWVEISCAKRTFNLVGLGAEEFPPLPSFENKNYLSVNSATAREMIDRTLFAVSTDETRYHLNGVFFEAIENNLMRMVSTDGHRLAFIDKELFLNASEQFQRGIIIPKKGLTELRRLIDDTKAEVFAMVLDKGNLLIKQERSLLFIRLIEGDYPDYEQVIPKKNDKRLTVDREELLGSLRSVSLLANEKSRGVKLSLRENEVVITSSNSDLGDAKAEIEADYHQEPVEIGFNARYMIECLQILDTEKVTLDINDKLSPGLLRPFGKSDYTYIVMPMRI